MELVDPNVNSDADGNGGNEAAAAAAAAAASGNAAAAGPGSKFSHQPSVAPSSAAAGHHREGWGTSEATEMITNNLFYITVKVRNFLILIF